MRTKAFYIIAMVIAFTLASFFLFLITRHAIELHETGECLQWRKHAQVNTGFYLTEWQEAQCEARGVNVWK